MFEGKKVRRKSWGKDEWVGTMGFNMHGYLSYDDWDIYEPEGFLGFVIEIYEEIMQKPEMARVMETLARKKQ